MSQHAPWTSAGDSLHLGNGQLSCDWLFLRLFDNFRDTTQEIVKYNKQNIAKYSPTGLFPALVVVVMPQHGAGSDMFWPDEVNNH